MKMLLAGVAMLALSAGSALGETASEVRSRIEVPGTSAPIDLAPSPEAPPMQAPPRADAALAVVAAGPAGQAQGNFRPTITFSKPIAAPGSVEGAKEVTAPARIEPPIEGEWRWLGSARVEYAVKGRIPYSTRFTVTVPAGLRALDGTALEKAYSYSFETPRPKVQKVEPAPGWRWLTPGQQFTVLFNQPVADLARHLRLEAGGEAWPADVIAEAPAVDEARAEEKGRCHPRGDLEERGSGNRQTRYRIVPRRPLPLDREVTLTLLGGLRGAEGTLAMQQASFGYRTYGPLRVEALTGCPGEGRCTRGPLVISTSNRIDVATLRSRLSMEPRVEIDWDHVEAEEGSRSQPPRVALRGDYRPGTRYQVRLAAGVMDVFGQGAPEASGSFSTADLDPSFDLGGGTALLEAGGDGSLPVESVNLTRLVARVWRLRPADVARMGEREERKPAGLPGAPAEVTLDVSGAMNAARTTPLSIRQVLGGKGGKRSALFLAEVSAPEIAGERPQRTQRVLGQITDLVVHAKLGATSGVVWVTRLSEGKPVSAAELALHDGAGRVRWRGQTDADGFAAVPGLAVLGIDSRQPGRAPFALVAAAKDGDTGVTLSTWSGALGQYGLPIDWDGKAPRSLGAVFAERGIYRPGETVHLKGVVRYRRLGKIVAPEAGATLEVKVTSSRGKEVFARRVTTTAYGTFAASFSLDQGVERGTFTVAASGTIGPGSASCGGSFRVEEDRPPQLQVVVDSPTGGLASGDELGARVMARHLSGGAMAGADVRWSVNRSTVDFEPPGNPGFTFGALGRRREDEAPARSADVVCAGEGETDAQGGLAVRAGRAEAPEGRAWEYALEAEGADVNRQRLAARATVTVHPASWYAGVRRRGTGFAEVGKLQAIEAVAVSPAGARQERLALTVNVKRCEWRSSRKKDLADRWTTVTQAVEETVRTCRLESAKEPVECVFTPDRPGMYVAEATVTDDRERQHLARVPFHVVGEGWVSWQRDDTDRLELVPDKAVYEVGETARVLVKSPFPQAEAILTVEREGITTSRRVQLSGAATALEIPLGEEAIPNVFVSVLLVRGRVPPENAGSAARAPDDPSRPAVRVGYAQLEVERRRKRLEVTLTPDRAERRPREKVRLDVQVKDWRGRGTPAEVTVWAVDEAVLRLTGYQVPDPVEMIHPPRGLSVRLGEPLIRPLPGEPSEPGGPSGPGELHSEKGVAERGNGGGERSGSGFRSRSRATVLFAPEVLTGPDGRAQVEFELPDDRATYRVMAVAVTSGEMVGRGQSQVIVAKLSARAQERHALFGRSGGGASSRPPRRGDEERSPSAAWRPAPECAVNVHSSSCAANARRGASSRPHARASAVRSIDGPSPGR